MQCTRARQPQGAVGIPNSLDCDVGVDADERSDDEPTVTGCSVTPGRRSDVHHWCRCLSGREYGKKHVEWIGEFKRPSKATARSSPASPVTCKDGSIRLCQNFSRHIGNRNTSLEDSPRASWREVGAPATRNVHYPDYRNYSLATFFGRRGFALFWAATPCLRDADNPSGRMIG